MGRPASFNRGEVIQVAADLFWRQGYYSTSISDLVDLTSLNPGSLYNAFNNKQGLLLEAIQYYGEGSFQRAYRCFHQPNDIHQASKQFFYALIDVMQADKDCKGCLLVNTWLEVAHHDETVKLLLTRIFDRVEAQFCAGFNYAKKRGQLAESVDPAALAKFMMVSIWGLRVMSRVSSKEGHIQQVVEQLLIGLESMVAAGHA